MELRRNWENGRKKNCFIFMLGISDQELGKGGSMVKGQGEKKGRRENRKEEERRVEGRGKGRGRDHGIGSRREETRTPVALAAG